MIRKYGTFYALLRQLMKDWVSFIAFTKWSCYGEVFQGWPALWQVSVGFKFKRDHCLQSISFKDFMFFLEDSR